MTIAEAQIILNETRAFITEIQSDRVVLLGPFKPLITYPHVPSPVGSPIT